MTTLSFTKGHGTGNDFVLFTDPEGERPLSPEQIRFLCDRRFGIADQPLDLLASLGESRRIIVGGMALQLESRKYGADAVGGRMEIAFEYLLAPLGRRTML